MPKMCGIFHHPLVNGVYITDPKHISFIIKTRRDFRPADEVCTLCRNSMKYMYELKLARAKELQKSRRNTVSTVSSSSSDSFDTMVKQTPLHRKVLRIDNKNSSLTIFPSLLTCSEQIEKQEDLNQLGSSNSSRTSIVEKQNLKSTSTEVLLKTINDEAANNRPNGYRVTEHLRNMIDLPVDTPTVYTDDAENSADSLNVRLSQQPTTSAAARAKTIPKPARKLRDLRAYFTPVQATRGGAKKNRIPLLRVSPSPTPSETPVVNPGGAKKNRTPLLRVSPSPTPSETPVVNPGVAKKRRRPLLRDSPSPTPSDKAAIIPEQSATTSLLSPLTVRLANVDDGATSDASDDDIPLRSLNYFNPEVRCPQYQPIPKRRPFHHDNKTVMDIYLKGLKGG